MSKVVNSIKEVIQLAKVESGMTISFHHHLRNGDFVANHVLQVLSDMGIKDLRLAISGVFPNNAPFIKYIQNGVITSIDTNYMAGPVAKAVTQGILEKPVMFRTHGGRPRAIEDGELEIDIAFIAAPSADKMGNLNGIFGPSACGSLGYAIPDAKYAKKVIAVTDSLQPYPLTPISIDQTQVDYVVKVDSIGDPKGIISGTTRITNDPTGHVIARYAAQVIKASGLFQNGFSFQTGAGGASLATAHYLREEMLKHNVKGSFGMGGITSYFVKMLEEGLFEKLIDVQCFDLEAIRSLGENPNHQEVSASFYANPHSKACAVDNLDIVILGATEIDLDFNVNVITDSGGIIMGGSGGHSDTAAGSKLSIIVANLLRTRLPVVVDRVTTKVTPGNTVDVLVTDRGIAVNPKNKNLYEKLRLTNLPIMTIEELQNLAERKAGKPNPIKFSDRLVAEVEYRDGNIIDRIFKPL